MMVMAGMANPSEFFGRQVMNKAFIALAAAGLIGTSVVPAQAQQYDYNRNNPGNRSQQPQYNPNTQYNPNNPGYGNRQFNVGVARLAAGTTISVGPDSQQGSLFLDPGRDQPGTLLIAEDVLDANGNLAIPAGAEVRGNFRRVKGGLKFVADSANINGRYYSMRASSKTLRDVKDPRETGGGAIAGDAALGAAGGALIGSLFGNAGTGAIGGAIAGTVVGNTTAPQVVVIDNNNPIDLRLEAPLSLR